MPALNPWALVAALVAVLGCFGSGTYVGKRWADGRHAVEQARTEANRVSELSNRIESERKVTASVAIDLHREREARTRDAMNFEEKLRNAPRETLTEVRYVEKPQDAVADQSGSASTHSELREAGGAARVALSARACSLWNDAIRAGFTEAERAGLIAGENPCAGAVEVEDALANLGHNAQLLGECRAREQRAQLWYIDAGLSE